MSRRGILITVTVCLLAIVAAWELLQADNPKTDAAKYERWKQTAYLFGKVMWCERHLPQSLVSPLHLSALDHRYIDEHLRLEDALLASGFLTNVAVAVAVAPTNAAQRAQVANRFRKVFRGRNEWEFGVNSNAVIVTCRPQSEPLCRQALQE